MVVCGGGSFCKRKIVFWDIFGSVRFLKINLGKKILESPRGSPNLIFFLKKSWQAEKIELKFCGISAAKSQSHKALVRQAQAVGISYKHLVSGPRGCRVLPPHFLRCSRCAFCRIGGAVASGEAAG
jgi:hypothetical protein